MITKKLLIFASFVEAQASIRKFQAQPLAGKNSLLEFEKGWIAISGIGRLNALKCVYENHSLAEEILSLGIAGGLNDQMEIGRFYEIGEISGSPALIAPHMEERSKDFANRIFPSFDLGIGSRLYSADFPIFDEKIRLALALNHDIVDMEGYGIAFASQSVQKKCTLWKLISDRAGAGEWKDIQLKLPIYSEQIAEQVNLLL